MNSNFPNRWSQASLTFNNYFYLFLYLYITWITINNNAPHLKSPKNQNRRAALGRPAIKITGGLELVCGRPTLALSSALVLQINIYKQQKQNTNEKQSKTYLQRQLLFTSFPDVFFFKICIISFSYLVKYIYRFWHLFLFAPVDHITSQRARAYSSFNFDVKKCRQWGTMVDIFGFNFRKDVLLQIR